MAHLSCVLHIALGKNVTRKEAVDQKIADQLEFKESEPPEQEVDSIMDSIFFAEEAIDGGPPLLYHIIHWKRERTQKISGIRSKELLVCDGHSKNITSKIPIIPLLHLPLLIKMQPNTYGRLIRNKSCFSHTGGQMLLCLQTPSCTQPSTNASFIYTCA